MENEHSSSTSNTQKPPTQFKGSLKLVFTGIIFVVVALIITTFLYKSSGPSIQQVATTPKTDVNSNNTAPSSSTPVQNENGVVPKLSAKMDVESSSTGQIKGTVVISNSSGQDLPNRYLGLYLREPDTTQVKTLTNSKDQPQRTTSISEGAVIAFSEQKIDILKQGTTNVSFSLAYSANISSGNYPLRMFIMDQQGSSSGGDLKQISLQGQGNYLAVNPTSCKVILNNTEFDENIAPPFNPNQQATAKCTFTNKNTTPTTVHLSQQYGVRNVVAYPLSSKQTTSDNQTITFKAGETKDINITLPNETSPQVYASLVSLIDDQNQIRSDLIPFRWTISGPSAQISKANLDKDYYAKGDAITANIDVSPSMDLYWRNAQTTDGVSFPGTDLSNPSILISVYNQSGTLCGQTQKPLPATNSTNYAWDAQIASFQSSINCLNPKLDAKVSEGNQVLAKLSNQIISNVQTPNAKIISPPNSYSGLKIVIEVLLGILAILIILCIILVFKGHRKNDPPNQVSQTLGLLIVVSVLSSLLAWPIINAPNVLANNLPPEGPISVTPSNGNSNKTITLYAWQGGSSAVPTSGGVNVSVTGDIGGLTGCGNGQAIVTLDNSVNGVAEYSTTISVNDVAGANGPISASFFVPSPSGTVNNFSIIIGLQWIHNRGISQSYSPDHIIYSQNFIPPTPTSISASSSCSSGLPNTTVQWGGSSNATSYNITRSDGATVASGTTGTSVQDTSVSRNTSYSYNVVACNGSGCSLAGSSNSVTTGWCDNTPPKTTISNFPPVGQTCLTQTDLQNNPVTVSSIDYGDGPGGSNPSGLKSVQIVVYDITTNTTVSIDQSNPQSISGNTSTTTIIIPYRNMKTSHIYEVAALATDNAGNPSFTSAPTPVSTKFDFDQTKCVAPFLQTTSGDVHSNKNINVPGGPQ